MTWLVDLLEALSDWTENAKSSFQTNCRLVLSICILIGVVTTLLLAGLFALVGIAAAPSWLQWTIGSIVVVPLVVGAFYPGKSK